MFLVVMNYYTNNLPLIEPPGIELASFTP